MTITMEDPITVAMIDRWTTDYYSRLVWKQFEKDGSVLCSWVRDSFSVQNGAEDPIIAREVLDDKECILHMGQNRRLLIDFMCKVSSGEKLFEDIERSRPTLLEEAIEILDKILKVDELSNRLDRDSISRLKLLLRTQAVLVCCRKNEFDLANEVFGREWRHWKNQNEMEIRQNSLNVIELRSSNHAYLDSMPYSSLIDGARVLLREIFSLLKTPFLVTAAQSVYKNYSSIMENYSVLECQNFSNESKQASSFGSEGTGTCNSTSSNDIKPNQTEKIRIIESETGTEVTALKYESLQTSPLETDIVDGIKISRKSLRKFKDKCSNSSRAESEINDNEHVLPVKMSNLNRKRKETMSECFDWEAELSSAVMPSPEARPRRFWQPEEEEAIYLGVQKYGVGQWRKVADSLGSDRTNVDIKDKWRTMTKQGKLKAYEKLFGPID